MRTFPRRIPFVSSYRRPNSPTSAFHLAILHSINQSSSPSATMAPPSKALLYDGPFRNMNDTEMKLLVLAHMFDKGSGPTNYEEMAKWTGIKASSAATLYRGAKRKLNKYMDGTTTSTTMPAKAVPAPKRAKKSTAKTAKGVAKAEEEEIVEYPAAIIKKEPIDDSDDKKSDLRASQIAVEISTLAAQAVRDASDATTASIVAE
ncbi:hypothetical protein N7522_007998 [Penicillium canescens]|nr:hypothetical protein N7522_007998 [Penicillium canescens]